MSRYLRDYELSFLIDGRDDNNLLVYSSADQQRPLHIKFKANYDEGVSKINLSIFNMSPVSRQLLQSEDIKVLLKVGFRDTEKPNEVTFKTLFLGTVSGALTTITTNADHETKITITEGYELKEIKINTSFGPGTSQLDVIRALLADVEKASGGMVSYDSAEIDALRINAGYDRGFTLTGVAETLLTHLLHKYNLRFVVTQGVLRVLKDGQSVRINTIKFDTDSGLLSVPKPLAQKHQIALSNPLPTKGYKFKVLLTPELIPTARVEIQHPLFNDGEPAELIVSKITHTGSYEGNEWYSDVEALIESPENSDKQIATGTYQKNQENIEYFKLLTQG